jgi:hypothetical protein
MAETGDQEAIVGRSIYTGRISTTWKQRVPHSVTIILRSIVAILCYREEFPKLMNRGLHVLREKISNDPPPCSRSVSSIRTQRNM